MTERNRVILVTGATGFLGKRVCRALDNRGVGYTRTSLSLGTDLRSRDATMSLFDQVRPTDVLNCAAYVGGIQFGYKHPAELFSNNLLMSVHLLEGCHRYAIRRMVNPISNCAYPANATLFRESQFWDGPLHESVMVYGFVRKASWVGAWAYAKQYGVDVLSLILSNMYGPEDHFEAERSHALGALIMKFVDAKRGNLPYVEVWGTGKPVREWLHVDDGAQAMILGLDAKSSLDPVNIGIAQGVSILDMAKMIKAMVGYQGEIRLDPSKPDGAPYKTVDGSRGAELLGWSPQIPFDTGVRETIQWYSTMRQG
jgi:GDP-L-fucose synthase